MITPSDHDIAVAKRYERMLRALPCEQPLRGHGPRDRLAYQIELQVEGWLWNVESRGNVRLSLRESVRL